MYSQNNEEHIILEYFGGTFGRFYDIGAWDGKTFSNVRALLDRGWAGVMVEPSPAAFVQLMRNTEQYGDRVTLLNAALGPKPALMEFHDAGGDAVGSLSPQHAVKWGLKRKFLTHVLPISSVFEVFGPAQFINLDVESINHVLFALLPLGWPELRCICVEHDGFDRQMEALAAPHGFKRIGYNAENLILAR